MAPCPPPGCGNGGVGVLRYIVDPIVRVSRAADVSSDNIVQLDGKRCWGRCTGLWRQSCRAAPSRQQVIVSPQIPRTAVPMPSPHVSGMGKTTCALWLSRQTQYLDRTWLFVSLPSVEQPFAQKGLVHHLAKTFGFTEQGLQQLRAHPLVLILDSLDEVPRHPDATSWWELNGIRYSLCPTGGGGRIIQELYKNLCISNSARNFCTQLVWCVLRICAGEETLLLRDGGENVFSPHVSILKIVKIL